MSMIQLRAMCAADWDAVRRIYREGIDSGRATLETALPTWADWDAQHHKDCRLIAMRNKQIVGWAALLPVSHRYVYRGVAEVSIYIGEAARGKGIGTKLLKALVRCAEAHNFWTLQAGIMRINAASIKLHEKCGFRMVGYRERIGQLHGVWHDTVIMERRSQSTGDSGLSDSNK